MKNKIDKIFGLAVALGTQKRIRQDIDKEYSKLENEYYNEVRKLDKSQTAIFSKYAIETSEYIKQCFGIVMYNTMNKKPLIIDRLIKKSYRHVFNYYNNNRNRVVAVEEFTHYYIEKSGGLESISGLYLDYCYHVLDYLVEFRGGKLYEGKLLTDVREQLILSIYDTTKWRLEVLNAMEGFTPIQKEKIESKTKEFLNSFKSSVGLGENVSILLENLKLKDEEILLNMGYPEVTESNYADMPRHKIVNSLTLSMVLCDIEPSFLQEAEIDEDIIEGIVRSLQVTGEEHSIPTRELVILFIASLFIYSISREYNKLRNVHYEGLKTKVQEKESRMIEEHRKELSDLQELLEVKNAETKQLKEELIQVRSVRSNQDKQMKEMELELKRLRKENEKLKEGQKELDSLRSSFLAEEEDSIDIDVSDDVLVDKLNQIKGVFVGGDSSLQSTLKEVLPNFTFIHSDDLTKDLKHIRSKEIVYISKLSNNHGLYYKINSIIRGSDVELVHLNGKTNSELILREMYSKLKVLRGSSNENNATVFQQ